MAKTQMAPSMEDQISLEPGGGGSGLLDLTRESDDTSLGAEILDHIDMEGSVGSSIGAEIITEQESYEPPQSQVGQPAVVEATDPGAGIFNGAIVGCCVLTLLVGGIMFAVTREVLPGYLEVLMENMILMVAGGLVLLVIAAVVGWLFGKSASPKQPASQEPSV